MLGQYRQGSSTCPEARHSSIVLRIVLHLCPQSSYFHVNRECSTSGWAIAQLGAVQLQLAPGSASGAPPSTIALEASPPLTAPGTPGILPANACALTAAADAASARPLRLPQPHHYQQQGFGSLPALMQAAAALSAAPLAAADGAGTPLPLGHIAWGGRRARSGPSSGGATPSTPSSVQQSDG